jgi:hypothetical protein
VYYGSGIAGDTLNNHQISSIDVDYRFRAAYSGALSSILWYDIHKADTTNTGYSNGTGGTLQICIQTDDGSVSHLPSGVNLACVNNNSPKSSYFPVEVFPTPPILVAGTLYHIRWHNTDPAPDSNFVSVDASYAWDATVPRQPTISDTDLAVFQGNVLRPNDTPIFQVNYASGAKQGNGYMEHWGSNAPLISGNGKVREQFTVSGANKQISHIAVRMKRDSTNTGSSPLTIRLETGAGVLIEEGTVPATTFPVGTRNDTSDNHNAWGTYNFSVPRTLTSGQSYNLVLSAPADTIYSASGIRRGPSYGFTNATYFPDGFAQYTVDGGSTWSGFDQPGGFTNSTLADLQFYFW